MGKILVTGGAGYIGSHIVRILLEAGRDVVVVDNLCEGHREAIPEGVRLVESDFGNTKMLDAELSGGQVDFVVHMAAFCEVGQSVSDPAMYYRNNVTESLELLDASRRHGVKGVVFSSTAAVYGEPRETPIDEAHPQLPTNPYGETKLAIERALGWFHGAYGMKYVALRYFNAAGAHPDGDTGEDHRHESHLVPRLLLGVREGGQVVPIFGNDYPTPDGTCVRDYVHVMDLAQAHVLAIGAMEQGQVQNESFNLGNGSGFSVLDVVDRVGEVTGQRPETRISERRPGDPATLVASSERVTSCLGWKPAFPSLESIIETAWNWHQRHPRGYAAGPVDVG